MPPDPSFIDRLADSPFAVGAVGAFVAARLQVGGSWQEKLFNGACGAAIAGYLSPALLDYFGRTEPSYRSAGAFIVGLLGMSISAALIQGIRDTPLGVIITGWLSRRGDTK